MFAKRAHFSSEAQSLEIGLEIIKDIHQVGQIPFCPTDPTIGCHPTWSWDGTRILYASDYGGKVNLYMLSLV